MRAKGEGTYWARPNGTFRYRIVVDGRRIDGFGPTRKQAKAAALKKLQTIGAKAKAGTLDALFQDWHAAGPAQANLRPTTFDQYASLLRVWVIPTLGKTQLRKLTKQSVVDCMKTWTHSASSQRSTYAAFVKLIDYAVGQELFATNIVRLAPRPVAPPPHTKQVPADAFARLLKAADKHRWQIAIWLAFAAGMRRGEILGLRWYDIDFDRATITVSERGNITRSSAGLVEGPPKTKAGIRQIHISAPLKAALIKHKHAVDVMRLAAPVWADSDYVLVTHLGGAVEPRSLSRAWKGWARTAKLTGTGMHAGRYYASTVMLSSGQASIADVAATMGHDPAVLLSTYAAAVADGQRRATDALGQALVAEVTSEVTSRKRATKRAARR